MKSKVLLIVFGLLFMITGIIAIPFLFVYSMTESSSFDFLYYVFFGMIALGISFLVMAVIKPAQQDL